jgi:N-acetylglucosamine kinase-like BadF-type ATPase
VGVIVAADGGNSKTELVVATLEGELRSYVRGPGSNSHAIGAEATAAVLAALVERAGLEGLAEQGTFFLCGADIPSDVEELTDAVRRRGWARRATVDNDTFGLLRVGTDAADAVAVICGAGMNCVGRARGGRAVRYPSLGWETGDWGGSEAVGREALTLAARGEDGRGEPTAIGKAIRRHFGLSLQELGEAVHYRRLPQSRLGEIAPAVVELADGGDVVARGLVDRLAAEIALVVRRAFRDLELEEGDVVFGGGMLAVGSGYLFHEAVARTTALVPGARPRATAEPPVLGAALAALDEAGATPEAAERLRRTFGSGVIAEDVDGR